MAKSKTAIYLFSVVVFKFCPKERGFFVPCVSPKCYLSDRGGEILNSAATVPLVSVVLIYKELCFNML